MIFELQRYDIKPGKMDAWIKFMDEVIVPFQMSKGMVIPGCFFDAENDKYIWIRRFENEAEREQQYEAVYQSDHWKNELSAKVGEMINRETIDVTRMQASPRSYIR